MGRKRKDDAMGQEPVTPYCQATQPVEGDMPYACTRPEGHVGDHTAIHPHTGRVLASWARLPYLTREEYDRLTRRDDGGLSEWAEEVTGGVHTQVDEGATDRNIESAIRHLAAQMEMPVHVWTQRDLDALEESVQRNSYAFTVGEVVMPARAYSAEDYDRILGQEPEPAPAEEADPVTTVALTITTESGELARIERSVMVSDREEGYAAAVHHALHNVLRMGEYLR